MKKDEIRSTLLAAAEPKYKAFSEKIIPGETEILGVRLPLLHKIAKEVARGDYLAYFDDHYEFYHEECVILALTLQYIKTDFQTTLSLFDRWIYCVRNWAICDIGVVSIANFAKPENKEILLNYLKDKLENSTEPMTRRVCIVSIFYYFIDGTHDEKVYEIFASTKVNTYYEMMALAWGVAELVIKNYPLGVRLLSEGCLDATTQNKAISKCTDSFRLDCETKKQLKKFKKTGEN